MKKVTIQLEQLVCPTCAQKIETALKNAPGVESVTVLFNSSKAKVQYNEETTEPETLAAMVRDLGYDVLKLI
ncbi:MAG TPA: heavy metal-associated domain-containing protein [Oscillospiraceae bacterium]|nr:heavy-metal-associated domain-containing protein [Oscillospiraceae bacterium]HNW05087.1 heavy metal-associated domain-containing protein [Oscillospiraceae bacterium]